MSMEKFYLKYCNLTGKIIKSTASTELKESVKFLKWKISPEKIKSSAIVSLLAGLIFVFLLIVFSILIKYSVIHLLFLLVIPILFFYLITEYPKILMKSRATEALGFSPQIISQISIPLRMNPNLETSLAIAVESGNSEIILDLKHILWDIWSGKSKNLESELKKLADKWGKFSKGFQRSIYLILGSFHESNLKKKHESLDKSVKSILDDISEKMKDYANSLHTPTLILFSLGIIVPLMIISVFPIVSFFGMSINPESITLFIFTSLVASYLYSLIILKKRPASFSVQGISSKIPDGYLRYKSKLFPVKPIITIILFSLSIPTFFYLLTFQGVVLSGIVKKFSETFNTFSLIWALGISLTIYFYSKSIYKKQKRDNIKKLENEFLDSLYHIQNRLSDGKPIETCIEYVSEIMHGSEIQKLYTKISNKINRRSISVEKAISEEKIESGMINSSFKMILTSLKNGSKAAAKTSSIISKYLQNIKDVNKSLTTMLDKNLAMMKTTAMFFAPIVCGIIIVLFQMITITVATQTVGQYSTTFQSSIETPILTLIIGLYLLGLNYVLIRYISRIQHGSDNIILHYNLYKSFPVVLTVFTVTILIAQFALAGWLI